MRCLSSLLQADTKRKREEAKKELERENKQEHKHRNTTRRGVLGRKISSGVEDGFREQKLRLFAEWFHKVEFPLSSPNPQRDLIQTASVSTGSLQIIKEMEAAPKMGHMVYCGKAGRGKPQSENMQCAHVLKVDRYLEENNGFLPGRKVGPNPLEKILKARIITNGCSTGR